MSGRGSGAVSPEVVFERTVAEAVRRVKLQAPNDPMFVPPADDFSFIMAVRMFASRASASSGRTLTFGDHLTGGAFDGTTDITLATDATDAADPDTIVARDASGDFAAHEITSDLVGDVTGNLTGDSTGTHTGPVVGDVTAVNGAITHLTAGDGSFVSMPTIGAAPVAAAAVASTHKIAIQLAGVTYYLLLST